LLLIIRDGQTEDNNTMNALYDVAVAHQ